MAKLFINERRFFSKIAHVTENAVLFLIAQPLAQRLNTFCLMMARHFQIITYRRKEINKAELLSL